MERAQVGGRAPEVRVIDANDREVELSSYWRDRPAILAFLRHFG